MTPQERQRLMLVVLIASVLFGLYMKPWAPREQPVPELSPEATVASVVAGTAEPGNQIINYASEWPAVDPFTRHDEKQSSTQTVAIEAVSYGEPTFSLQGIMTINGQIACVIGGKTYTAGSQVSGWKLEKIDTQGVWVSQGGERHFVPLP